MVNTAEQTSPLVLPAAPGRHAVLARGWRRLTAWIGPAVRRRSSSLACVMVSGALVVAPVPGLLKATRVRQAAKPLLGSCTNRHTSERISGRNDFGGNADLRGVDLEVTADSVIGTFKTRARPPAAESGLASGDNWSVSVILAPKKATSGLVFTAGLYAPPPIARGTGRWVYMYQAVPVSATSGGGGPLSGSTSVTGTAVTIRWRRPTAVPVLDGGTWGGSLSAISVIRRNGDALPIAPGGFAMSSCPSSLDVSREFGPAPKKSNDNAVLHRGLNFSGRRN
jgi:hypothetical protein